MPIIYNETVFDDIQLGIWEIEESFEEMADKIHFFEGELERLENYKSTARQIEWLSVRRLLREMLGHPGQIIYNENRKPFLINTDLHISISHSRNMTSIMLSKTRKIGLDLEFMSHNIEKVEHKFINEEEFIVDDHLRHFHLYIHWCAKEALYKICDKQDINFRKNLVIDPFEPDDCGEVVGWVNNRFWHDKFIMRYFKIKEYVLVYCWK